MIQLEKFDKTFYSELINSIKNAKDLMQFGGPEFSFPLTEKQIDKTLSDENRIAFRVANSSDGNTIGHCEIYFNDNSAKLGRILIMDENQRGKGIGEQMVILLLEFILKNRKERNIELNVFDFNIGAIKCYEKVGFTINPDKKLIREVDGETWTAFNMVLNLEDWKN
ncbi:RimJ/RimL family protein N-acetyltransferase [Flavobacterium cutihirudinis]|uniref:RimJ/RimL family protein N-acetyltransferase n=1 Tax=Flavobacterium cutihirudinis TaxID=1265740 RepID=A0A3D9FV75_9FLAO|nr:GNAT family protein [Flavobacterium cutihirudinis]RED24664.1 RimJ/RimL family protein N-acetyltransferase [Flavobacterium cutihirudinis]